MLAAAAGAVVLVGGCGSDAAEDATPAEVDEQFCEAVTDYAAAAEALDTQAMADALAVVVDDLPDEDRQVVSAHIDSLAAASSTDPASDDGVDNPEAAEAFEGYARETCGDDALAPAGDPEATGGGEEDPGVAPGSSTTEPTTTSSTTGPGSAGSTPSESDPSGEDQGDGESYPEGDPGSTGEDDLGG